MIRKVGSLDKLKAHHQDLIRKEAARLKQLAKPIRNLFARLYRYAKQKLRILVNESILRRLINGYGPCRDGRKRPNTIRISHAVAY